MTGENLVLLFTFSAKSPCFKKDHVFAYDVVTGVKLSLTNPHVFIYLTKYYYRIYARIDVSTPALYITTNYGDVAMISCLRG